MQKLAIFCLFSSFLFCYLEWSDQSAFVFEVAHQLLFQKEEKASAFTHPFVLLPFLGQLIVLACLFLKQPKKWMIISGIVMMGLLVAMLMFIGVAGRNWKIFVSTLPFAASAIWCLRTFKQGVA